MTSPLVTVTRTGTAGLAPPRREGALHVAIVKGRAITVIYNSFFWAIRAILAENACFPEVRRIEIGYLAAYGRPLVESVGGYWQDLWRKQIPGRRLRDPATTARNLVRVLAQKQRIVVVEGLGSCTDARPISAVVQVQIPADLFDTVQRELAARQLTPSSLGMSGGFADRDCLLDAPKVADKMRPEGANCSPSPRLAWVCA